MPGKKQPARDPSKMQCEVCGQPALPDEIYCTVHLLVAMATNKAREALSKGRFQQAALNTIFAIGAPILDRAAVGAAAAATSAAFRPRPPAPPPKADPWEVLGLDPASSTVDDVRQVARELAKIYHPDKQANGGARAVKKMAEINAAVAAALAQLRKAGK